MKFDKFSNELLIWHFQNKRNFKWRETTDPYKILVSEVMLQKTDADKVEIVFPEFIKKFPTIKKLAGASVDEIAESIKLLGLAYRAERLKRIAVQVVEKFDGKVPDNKKDLLSLYGVGNYISNAVLCFVFEKNKPILDANVIRIFERVFSLKTEKSRAREDKEMWKFAEKIVPKDNAKEYNYALLDFASKICRARNPLCEICPIKSICTYERRLQRLSAIKNSRSLSVARCYRTPITENKRQNFILHKSPSSTSFILVPLGVINHKQRNI